VKRRATAVAGLLPDMPHLNVDPGVVVTEVKRAIRSVRTRLGA